MGEVAAEMYTQDGTVDIKGNPALKKDTGNWRACPYILANECCERLAYYGMSTNLVNFMKDRMGMANAAAANNVTNWGGTCYITPLIGAFLADAYLGRFWTIASFMIIYIFGLGLLTMATSVHGLVPTCAAKGVCDPEPDKIVECFRYLWAQRHAGCIDWGMHASNYWVCDGIIQGQGYTSAWEVGNALKRNIHLDWIMEYIDNHENIAARISSPKDRWVAVTHQAL